MIDVAALTVHVPRRDDPVLRDIDLRVAPGERVLVLGASGSGKTTLLRALSGIVPHSMTAEVDGAVTVADRAVADTPVAELAIAGVGAMFQDPDSQLCLPRVDDDVALALESRAVTAAEIGPRVAGALDRVGASHLSGRRAAALSGGEQQRVALAATLVADPDLLLLDEPTALLDPESAAGVGRLVAGAGQRADGSARTVVLVEHRLDELTEHADLPERIVALDGGRILADGPTAAVLAEHGRRLAAAGCWLPLGAELALATGYGDPAARGADLLADPRVAARVREFAALAAGAAPVGPGAGGAGRGPALSARAAAFALDGPPVVHDVDLDLRPGEITAIVGPNGAGKTTLLLGLSGLIDTVAGRVERPPGGVAMVFQQPEHQFLGRTAAAEIGHGLGAAGRRDRVAAQLTDYGLDGVAGQDPFRLSGGEKRRLSVAAMAVLDRPVLLLDEPTFGQDRRNADAVVGQLRRLAAAGVAVGFTCHDLRLVGRIADRVLVVHNGRISADGPAEELLADGDRLAAAGLRRPALLEWWAGHARDLPLRAVLGGLADALAERAVTT